MSTDRGPSGLPQSQHGVAARAAGLIAASEQGADLDELRRIGNKVNSVMRTMGMALTSCTPPAKGSPLFDLGDDEMEMGVGADRGVIMVIPGLLVESGMIN